MSHPHTSEFTGFRSFDGSSFGELQLTEWEFDGSESDVRDFAEQNLCSHGVDVGSVSDLGSGTFDVELTSGDDYRVYAVPHEGSL